MMQICDCWGSKHARWKGAGEHVKDVKIKVNWKKATKWGDFVTGVIGAMVLCYDQEKKREAQHVFTNVLWAMKVYCDQNCRLSLCLAHYFRGIWSVPATGADSIALVVNAAVRLFLHLGVKRASVLFLCCINTNKHNSDFLQ